MNTRIVQSQRVKWKGDEENPRNWKSEEEERDRETYRNPVKGNLRLEVDEIAGRRGDAFDSHIIYTIMLILI